MLSLERHLRTSMVNGIKAMFPSLDMPTSGRHHHLRRRRQGHSVEVAKAKATKPIC